jgi:hypothetical protein
MSRSKRQRKPRPLPGFPGVEAINEGFVSVPKHKGRPIRIVKIAPTRKLSPAEADLLFGRE